MHECRDCNQAKNVSNNCSLCKKSFSCYGYELYLRDKGYLTETLYSTVCPSCISKILRTMIRECEGSGQGKGGCVK